MDTVLGHTKTYKENTPIFKFTLYLNKLFRFSRQQLIDAITGLCIPVPVSRPISSLRGTPSKDSISSQ